MNDPFLPWMLIFSLHLAEKEKEEFKKPQKLGKFGKDPGVETSFLPDRYDYCTSLHHLTFITSSWWMRAGMLCMTLILCVDKQECMNIWMRSFWVAIAWDWLSPSSLRRAALCFVLCASLHVVLARSILDLIYFSCIHSCHKSYYAMKSVEGGTAESVRRRNKLRENDCEMSGSNSNLASKVPSFAISFSYLVY